eukprot:gene1955-1463_t
MLDKIKGKYQLLTANFITQPAYIGAIGVFGLIGFSIIFSSKYNRHHQEKVAKENIQQLEKKYIDEYYSMDLKPRKKNIQLQPSIYFLKFYKTQQEENDFINKIFPELVKLQQKTNNYEKE